MDNVFKEYTSFNNIEKNQFTSFDIAKRINDDSKASYNKSIGFVITTFASLFGTLLISFVGLTSVSGGGNPTFLIPMVLFIGFIGMIAFVMGNYHENENKSKTEELADGIINYFSLLLGEYKSDQLYIENENFSLNEDKVNRFEKFVKLFTKYKLQKSLLNDDNKVYYSLDTIEFLDKETFNLLKRFQLFLGGTQNLKFEFGKVSPTSIANRISSSPDSYGKFWNLHKEFSMKEIELLTDLYDCDTGVISLKNLLFSTNKDLGNLLTNFNDLLNKQNYERNLLNVFGNRKVDVVLEKRTCGAPALQKDITYKEKELSKILESSVFSQEEKEKLKKEYNIKDLASIEIKQKEVANENSKLFDSCKAEINYKNENKEHKGLESLYI